MYFGGAGSESPSAMAVNQAGEIVIAGTTSGVGWQPSGFPVTEPLESGPNPGISLDVFVAAFRPSDLSVTFSTLFGGAGHEDAIDMALDAHGNPWIVGQTRLWGDTRAPLPTLNPFQAESGEGEDAFLVHLSLRDATLRIRRSGQTLTLSWPVGPTNYLLEAADSPAAAVWQTITETPVVIGGERSVELAVAGHARFFRLRTP